MATLLNSNDAKHDSLDNGIESKVITVNGYYIMRQTTLLLVIGKLNHGGSTNCSILKV